jgi:uncharacterized membrane protein
MRASIRTSDSVSLALIVGSFALTGAVYARLPERVPVHFNIHGVADGWMDRGMGAWVLPLTTLVIWSLVRFGGLLLPEATRARVRTSSIDAVNAVTTALLVALQCVILHAALARRGSVATELGVTLGVFWVVLGLLLPRVRRNRWVGVRTPWTLTSDENWAKTHRIAGLTFVIGGAMGVLLTLAGAGGLGLALILASGLIPALYSYAEGRHRRSGI